MSATSLTYKIYLAPIGCTRESVVVAKETFPNFTCIGCYMAFPNITGITVNNNKELYTQYGAFVNGSTAVVAPLDEIVLKQGISLTVESDDQSNLAERLVWGLSGSTTDTAYTLYNTCAQYKVVALLRCYDGCGRLVKSAKFYASITNNNQSSTLSQIATNSYTFNILASTKNTFTIEDAL